MRRVFFRGETSERKLNKSPQFYARRSGHLGAVKTKLKISHSGTIPGIISEDRLEKNGETNIINNDNNNNIV